MQKMDDRVQKLINGTSTHNDLKYVIYSAHDDQISNILLFLDGTFLNNTKFTFHDVPTCSQVYFEVYYDDECLYYGKGDASCFWVQNSFNGWPFTFDYCTKLNQAKGDSFQYCYYTDFIAYLD